jgi:putative DNA primase/helicase
MIEAVQEDERAAVASAAPMPPNLGNDRAADNWTPLLKVAFVAGASWLTAAAQAARALTAADDGLPSTVEEFICDLVNIFNADSRDFIPTEDLLQALTADTERPWATFVRGRAIQNRDLATLMRQARVPVGEQHNDGTQNRRGYFRKHIQHLIDGYGS